MFISFWDQRLWADPDSSKLRGADSTLSRLSYMENNTILTAMFTLVFGGMGWILVWDDLHRGIAYPKVAWTFAIVCTLGFIAVWPYRSRRRRQIKDASATIRAALELGVAVELSSTTWRLLASALFYDYRIELATLVGKPELYGRIITKYVLDAHLEQNALRAAKTEEERLVHHTAVRSLAAETARALVVAQQASQPTA